MQTHLYSVLTVVILFFLGLMSPGPNFLHVAQTALNFGRAAGLVTGLAGHWAIAFYASIRLFGVTQLTRVGPPMIGIEFLGTPFIPS